MIHSINQDRFNNLLQKNLINRTNLYYLKDGPDHNPTHTCVIEIDSTELRSDPLTNKKDAYANVIDKFFAIYDGATIALSQWEQEAPKGGDTDHDIEVIIDLDNSADLLKLLDHPSIHVNAFAARQYTGNRPTSGTLEFAKSFVHDATDLLIAYRSKEIVSDSSKRNILLVSKDSAFDSLYQELLSDFPSRSIHFISAKRELEEYLALEAPTLHPGGDKQCLRPWTTDAGLLEDGKFGSSPLAKCFGLDLVGEDAVEGVLLRPSSWNHFAEDDAGLGPGLAPSDR